MFRQLLVLTIALSLSACATATRQQADTRTPAEQLGWQLAIHERTFEKFTVFESIDKTAELGLKYMSLSGAIMFDNKKPIATANLTDEQIAAIKEHLKAKGVTLVNAYVSLPGNERNCRKEFEFARKMGIDILVGEPSEDALDTVEKLCEEYHIKVAIHDHPRPSHYWNPDFVLAAIKGHPQMGACADTGHWVRSGLDPVECLKKLQGHLLCLHFKDLAEKNPKSHDVPWGTGVANCKGMMEELQRQGFHGAFCAEYEYHFENSMPELAQCVKFFNNTCAELVASPTTEKTASR